MKSTYSETYQLLIDRLIRARKNCGMTQTDLALRVGKPQSYVSKIEICERRLDVVEFLELAQAIGEDPVKLISEIYRRWSC